MRTTTLVVTTLLAALALSVGAVAVPMALGLHSTAQPTAAAPSSAPTTAPAGDPNGTEPSGNATAPTPTPPAPSGNDTGGSVTSNVTVSQSNTTIWINGTLVVFADNRTVINMTFQVVVQEGQEANVSFGGTIDANGTTFTVNGTAVLEPAVHTIDVHGLLTVTRDSITLTQRAFEFALVWDQTGTPTFTASPLPGLVMELAVDHL